MVTVQAGAPERSANHAVSLNVASCSSGKHCVFIPAVHRQQSAPAATVDLTISGVEVTQAVQDANNSVPLVANRPTILRIFANVSGRNQPLSNVQVQVTATRGGAALSGLPQTQTVSLPLSASRANYGSTINISLPSGWLSGAVDLTVRLDPANAVSETDEKNNTLTRRLTFNPVAPLKVKIVPVRYTHTPDGRTYPAPTQDTVSDWIRRTYPVSQVEISWHAPYAFTGNLTTSDDFIKLLNQITSLKTSENASANQVYYGMVPTSDGSASWFFGGIAGVGWVGNRTSIGLNMNGAAAQIAAHEIGHNLGMPHTPCGSAAGADPNYPYKDGSIGQYGLDVYSGTLYTPEKNKDVMSYCDPKWVSDYTYKILFNSQVKVTGAPGLYYSLEGDVPFAAGAPTNAPQRSLMVRANLSAGGLQLLPAYVLPGQAAAVPEPGDYRVQVLGTQDEVLAEAPVRTYDQEVDGEELQGIHALLPLPDAPVAKLRLLQGDQVVAEQPIRVFTTDKLNGVQVQPDGDGYHVRWSATDRLALVRYTTDGGKTWTTLGVDQGNGEMHVSADLLPAPGGEFDVVLSDTWK